MPLVSLKTILAPAYKSGYAVGAFNVINSDFLDAVIDAAENASSPVILNVAEVHLKYMDMDVMSSTIIRKIQKSNIPVALNLDHGGSFEVIIQAIKNGFTSIMFDGSTLPYEENVSRTREIVKVCHAIGVSVEAELGAVGGSEGGELEGTINNSLFTNSEQAKDFVLKTGIDALAVAIGNAHGKYKDVPKLDFRRLDAIRESTKIPLVLHGGSGIPEEDFKKSITLGISKINFFTGMAQTAIFSMKESLNSKDMETKYNAFPEVLLKMRKAVSETVVEQMKIFGSVGKA